jgi:hypothetical protein
MAKNFKPIFRKKIMGYIPQINDDNIGHLSKKEQRMIVRKAQLKRKALRG